MFLAVTGSAHAQVINACAGKLTGLLRIVGARGQCTAFENPISWNVTGPEGPQGPAGVTAGIKTAVYGTVANDNHYDCSNDTLTLYPNPAPYTVIRSCGLPSYPLAGSYNITFTPNPFTPSTAGPDAFANRPTCMAVSRDNPFNTLCSASVGYSTVPPVGEWSLSVTCTTTNSDGTAYQDADFDFLCVQ